jgi:hypothetical protein
MWTRQSSCFGRKHHLPDQNASTPRLHPIGGGSDVAAPRLKVYRTHIGFYDAVVAAPSQKAALKAWGVHQNLFARGLASVVGDAEIIRLARATPGKVLRRMFGSKDRFEANPRSPRQADIAAFSRGR